MWARGVRAGVLASGTRVHVMAGTAEVLGRIMLLDDEPPIAVGETRVVQVRLERPLPLRAGDHAVILSYSPISLLGGGRVLLSRCRRARVLSAGERALYAALESGDVADGRTRVAGAANAACCCCRCCRSARSCYRRGRDRFAWACGPGCRVRACCGRCGALRRCLGSRCCNGCAGCGLVLHARGGSQGDRLYVRCGRARGLAGRR